LLLESNEPRKSALDIPLGPYGQWDGVVDSRGDIMLVLPDTVVVADVSVVHPAAPTYAAGAAVTDGAAAAARDRAKRAHYARASVWEAPGALVCGVLRAFGQARYGPAQHLGGRDGVQRVGLQERACDDCAPAQHRTVQVQRANVWGVPVHACPRQLAAFQPGLLVPVAE
jgi:hypothetical protein